LGLLGGKALKLERGPDCNCFERNQVDEFLLVIPGREDCGSPITEVGFRVYIGSFYHIAQ
jgi:hypothetical protein